MMQDRKALQAGTSHYLGQNFAKTSGITFVDEAGEIKNAYTTSWGVSTRLIGGVIMSHGDDDGLRVPPRIAPVHAVILPVITKEGTEGPVMEYAERIAASLRELQYHGVPLVVNIDKRDLRGGEKNWQWIKKGVPLRLEVGPRDLQGQCVMVARRDKGTKEKVKLGFNEIKEKIVAILDEIQTGLFEQARQQRDANIKADLSDFEELKRFFTPKNCEKPEIHGGFIRAKFCEEVSAERALDELKVTVRCLPLDQSGTSGRCIITGKPATTDAIFGKSY